MLETEAKLRHINMHKLYKNRNNYLVWHKNARFTKINVKFI